MLVSAAWIAPALLAAVSRLGQHRLWGEPAPSAAQLLFESLDWLVYGAFTPASFALSARWPLVGPARRRWAWLVHLLGSLAFCVAWAAVGTLLKALLGTDDFAQGVWVSFAGWFYITIPFGVGVYFGMVAIAHAIHHVTEVREWQRRAAEVEAQLTTARLAALEARLNPHFLFNALNTIAVLVRGGEGAAANRVVEELSDVLRLTLERPGQSEVPLGEELHLVERYLAVETARFPDRLRVRLDVPAELAAAAVPVFALQHLVENAVRHGIASDIAAGSLEVEARREGDLLVLTVHDDGTGIAPAAAELPGRGLANTRARLRALHGEAATLDVVRAPGGGTTAQLRVPYRELPVETGPVSDA